MSKLSIIVFLIFLSIIILINFFLFKPMFHSLAFACILAGVFYPLFKKIRNKTRFSTQLSGFITCTLIFCLIVLPLTYLFIQLSKESVGLYETIKDGLSRQAIKDFLFGNGYIAQVLDKLILALDLDIDKKALYQLVLTKVQSYSGVAISIINNIVGDTFTFFFQFLLMMLAIFGIFTQGDELKKYVFTLSPLPLEQEELILAKFSQMNYVSLICNGLGGVIQGVLAGLAFWIAGVNSVFLWTTVMVILAFIPLLGISIVYIPASLYFFLTGSKLVGVAIFVFCSIVALVVENWFKPKFIGQRIRINSLLLLFYIIAGMGSFGMAGIFYGPIICIIFLTFVELFLDAYLPQLQKKIS